MDREKLKSDVKKLLVANLMLQLGEEDIADDLPLFGPGGLGLDSVDALQIVVVLDKQYGLKIANPDEAREILQNVSTIAKALASLGPAETLLP